MLEKKYLASCFIYLTQRQSSCFSSIPDIFYFAFSSTTWILFFVQSYPFHFLICFICEKYAWNTYDNGLECHL